MKSAANLWRRFRWHSAEAGILIAIEIFVFQLGQSWVDSGADRSLLRWLVPISLCLALFGSAFAVFVLIHKYGSIRRQVPQSLADSILTYAKQLQQDKRDPAVISLRNNFSPTLHLLGFHEARTILGAIALDSATILDDRLTKAEVLVDDLGWANHLLGRDESAIRNIRRGIQTAHDVHSEIIQTKIRAALCEAKGLRHLAIIGDSETEAPANLEVATRILTGLDPYASLEIERDLAQLFHAKALIAAVKLGVQHSGVIRAADAPGRQALAEAVEDVRRASAIFDRIGDTDRYTKALFLEVRLLEASGAELEAKEAKAKRDRALSESEWITPHARDTILSVAR